MKDKIQQQQNIQPIEISLSPKNMPEGSYDPWQRYSGDRPIDIWCLAHRCLTGLVGSQSAVLGLTVAHAPFYWYLTIIIPIGFLIALKRFHQPDLIAIAIGCLAGIAGALL